jgi:hypothetical protein
VATFSIIADVMVRGLDSLKELTGQVDKLGNASDKTGKKLDSVGDKSKQTATKVAPLRDRLQDLGTMFRDSGDAGGRFGDVLDAASVATTPLGAGILALVAGVGAAKLAFDALSASVSMYIENNEEAARAADRLDVAISNLNESVVDLALGEGGLTLITTNLSIAAEEASENLDAFRASADGSKTASETLTERIAVARITMRNLGIATGGTGLALDALAAITTRLAADNSTLADSNRTLIRSFGDVVGAARRAGDAISSTVEQALVMLGLAESTTSKGMKVIGGKLAASPLGKSVAAGVAEVRKKMAPKRRGGGMRGKSRAELRQEGSRALLDEMYSDLLQDPNFLATLVPEKEEVTTVPRLSTGETVEEFKARMNGYGTAINDLKGEFEALDLVQEALFIQGFKAGEEIAETAKDSFIQLGSSVAFAMGEMAAGASTLKDFGDAMSDLAGQIAGSFGQLFIQLGAGFLLTAPAVGAGLIAAGLALQTLSGFLSGKGSGNRGGGGGGRSAASNAGRDIAREISRSLRPSGEDGPAVTNIEVVIGGRSIQPEMVAIVDDIARQRRSRYLGRRMGV